MIGKCKSDGIISCNVLCDLGHLTVNVSDYLDQDLLALLPQDVAPEACAYCLPMLVDHMDPTTHLHQQQIHGQWMSSSMCD